MDQEALRLLLTQHERLAHKPHQLEGVFNLVNDTDAARGRVIPRVFALFDEVGAAKTKQCVDSGQVLFLLDQLDTVVVVTPGNATSTWAHEDATLGEVAKHAWPAVHNVIHQYHGDYEELELAPNALNWIVTNYEFLRREPRLHALLRQLRGRRTWLILDESWAVKGFSDQMRACRTLRNKRAERATLLNGTPLADGKPMDLYYQFEILDPAIIGCKNRTHFRSKYCVMGGFQGKQVVSYKDLDDLNRRIAPYVQTNKTRDCWQLPPMLEPITLEPPLTVDTWKIYQDMRDELVAWFGTQASVSRQAIVKIMRLSQITSGYLGGLEDVSGPVHPTGVQLDLLDAEPAPSWMSKYAKPTTTKSQGTQAATPSAATTSVPNPGQVTSGIGPGVHTNGRVCLEISREKLDGLLEWLSKRQPRDHKQVTWCHFRPELERTARAYESLYPLVATLKGGQTKPEREATKRLLAPGGDPRPAAVVGIQSAGGASMNYAAAALMVFLSEGPSLRERNQAIGRIERPGQTQAMQLVNVYATGPRGQKTINHAVGKRLQAKDDMQKWTVNEWRRILAEA